MTARASLSILAVLASIAVAALALLPLLAFAVVVSTIALFLAWRSAAYPLGLASLPTLLVAWLGSNPFPQGAFALIVFVWIAAAIAFAVARDAHALPARLLLDAPVVASLALGVLMLARLNPSLAGDYGALKLKLFVTGNLALLIGGILVGRRHKDVMLFVLLTLIASALTAGLLFQQLLTGTARELQADRYSLPELNPILLSRQSAVGVIVAVYVVLVSTNAALRWIAVVLLPVLFVAMMAGGSRGPLLALLVGLATLVGLLMREAAARRRFFAVVAGCAAAAVLVPALVPGATVDRAFSIVGATSTGRTDLWFSAFDSFRDHVFWGLGTGGFASIAPPGELFPHNLFFEVAVELGLAGVFLLLLVLVGGASRLVVAWTRGFGSDRPDAALALSLVVSAVANAFLSGDIQTNAAIWLALGLGLGISARQRAAVPAEVIRARARTAPA